VAATAMTATMTATMTAVPSAGVVSAAMTAVVSVTSVTTPADIDKESTTGPIPATPAPSPPDWSNVYGREKPKHSIIGNYPGPNGVISVRRKRRPPPCPVDHYRVVTGHIDNCRISGFNLDILTFDNNLLLGGCHEIARITGLRPQSLNGCRDIGLLSHESVTHPLCPRHLRSHHGQYLRESRQRLYGLVPLHLLQGAIERVPRKARVCLYPLVRSRNISRICSRDKDLCQQGIRIERYWRKHLVKLCIAVGLGRR
jgi:hypothetical protein